MVSLEVRRGDVSYAEMTPLKCCYRHEEVMSRTAGGWGDPFGKNVAALLSVPPPPPTQRPRREMSVAHAVAHRRRPREERTRVQDEVESCAGGVSAGKTASGMRGGGVLLVIVTFRNDSSRVAIYATVSTKVVMKQYL